MFQAVATTTSGFGRQARQLEFDTLAMIAED
jgi:hypothetical protein